MYDLYKAEDFIEQTEIWLKLLEKKQMGKICDYCKKPKKNVKLRPTRTGTCNYCYECYEVQILMS